MQITIRRATTDDAEAISAIWEVVCAERVYTAVNRPFSPQQERDYIASLSHREGIFLAELGLSSRLGRVAEGVSKPLGRVAEGVSKPLGRVAEGVSKPRRIETVEGDVIGFMSLDLWAKYTDSFDHVGVMGTIILPPWRRRGIGRRLAEHTLDFARAKGYEKIVIYVRAGNTGAQAFYRSLGFVPKGILERQVKMDGRYEDEVFMERFLY
jgi:ribosomal protein S18 acetylase RimI-like enzyme